MRQLEEINKAQGSPANVQTAPPANLGPAGQASAAQPSWNPISGYGQPMGETIQGALKSSPFTQGFGSDIAPALAGSKEVAPLAGEIAGEEGARALAVNLLARMPGIPPYLKAIILFGARMTGSAAGRTAGTAVELKREDEVTPEEWYARMSEAPKTGAIDTVTGEVGSQILGRTYARGSNFLRKRLGAIRPEGEQAAGELTRIGQRYLPAGPEREQLTKLPMLLSRYFENDAAAVTENLAMAGLTGWPARGAQRRQFHAARSILDEVANQIGQHAEPYEIGQVLELATTAPRKAKRAMAAAFLKRLDKEPGVFVNVANARKLGLRDIAEEAVAGDLAPAAATGTNFSRKLARLGSNEAGKTDALRQHVAGLLLPKYVKKYPALDMSEIIASQEFQKEFTNELQNWMTLPDAARAYRRMNLAKPPKGIVSDPSLVNAKIAGGKGALETAITKATSDAGRDDLTTAFNVGREIHGTTESAFKKRFVKSFLKQATNGDYAAAAKAVKVADVAQLRHLRTEVFQQPSHLLGQQIAKHGLTPGDIPKAAIEAAHGGRATSMGAAKQFWSNLGRSVMDDVVKQSTDMSPLVGVETIHPDRLKDALDGFGRTKLNELFGTEHTDNLYKLVDIMTEQTRMPVGTRGKVVVELRQAMAAQQGVRTGFSIGGQLLGLGAALTGAQHLTNAAGAAGTAGLFVGVPYALSHMLSNPKRVQQALDLARTAARFDPIKEGATRRLARHVVRLARDLSTDEQNTAEGPVERPSIFPTGPTFPMTQ